MNRTVLVVDDDACITNVVGRKLQNAGFDVIVAMDGREAYERATAQRPDFLITDLQMPAMNGLELCARLTAELTEPIPTILLTAKGFEIDPSAIGGLPIVQVMTKPFSPRELLATVQGALAVGTAF